MQNPHRASMAENSELLTMYHEIYVNTVYLSHLHRCLFKNRIWLPRCYVPNYFVLIKNSSSEEASFFMWMYQGTLISTVFLSSLLTYAQTWYYLSLRFPFSSLQPSKWSTMIKKAALLEIYVVLKLTLPAAAFWALLCNFFMTVCSLKWLALIKMAQVFLITSSDIKKTPCCLTSKRVF